MEQILVLNIKIILIFLILKEKETNIVISKIKFIRFGTINVRLIYSLYFSNCKN